LRKNAGVFLFHLVPVPYREDFFDIFLPFFLLWGYPHLRLPPFGCNRPFSSVEFCPMPRRAYKRTKAPFHPFCFSLLFSAKKDALTGVFYSFFTPFRLITCEWLANCTRLHPQDSQVCLSYKAPNGNTPSP